MSDPWQLLGVTRGASIDDIRRAYARKLKTTRPDEDPEGFQALVNAREAALRFAQKTSAHARPQAPRTEPKAPLAAKAEEEGKRAKADDDEDNGRPQGEQALPRPPLPPDPMPARPTTKDEGSGDSGLPPPYRRGPTPPAPPPVPKGDDRDADTLPPPYRRTASGDGDLGSPKSRARPPAPPPPSRELPPPPPIERFEQTLLALEGAGEGAWDSGLLRTLASDISELTTVQRRTFEHRIARLLAKRILPNAKRKRRVLANSLLKDEDFCAFAVAMEAEFGWRDADRSLQPLFGAQDLQLFRHYLMGMADMLGAKAGHPPARRGLDGHAALNAVDLDHLFGAEASHFARIMREQGQGRLRPRWSLILMAPAWAMKYRLYHIVLLWFLLAFLIGQLFNLESFARNVPVKFWSLIALPPFLALSVYMALRGDSAVIARALRDVLRADKQTLYDPVVRQIHLRSRRPRSFLSDSLMFLATMVATALLITPSTNKRLLQPRQRPSILQQFDQPPRSQRPGSFPKALPQNRTGISVPRRPVDNPP